MRKWFFGFLFLSLCVASLSFGQTVISNKDLASAEKEGRILFKAKLVDASWTGYITNGRTEQLTHGFWILKFDNQAVTKIKDYVSTSKSQFQDHEYPIWWIGKSYIVYWDSTMGVASAYCRLLPEETK